MKRTSGVLFGRGVGPLIQLAGDGVLRIIGLLEGEKAQLIYSSDENVQLVDNGEHSLRSDSHFRVAYDGESKGFFALLET